MKPEHTLEELIQLAQPALRHAELINIAQTESPNKAQEKALSRWPRRQAKAARFLAMVRRDFGQDAFDVLIVSSSEHARPQGAEHARGVCSMVTIDSLFPAGIKNVAFTQDPHEKMCIEKLQIVRVDAEGKGTLTPFTQVCDELSLDKKGQEDLVRRVLACMLEHWVGENDRKVFYGHHWAVATFAVRTFLPNDKNLYKKTLLAAIVHFGGHAKYEDWFASKLLPEKPKEDTPALQQVIDYVQQVGCTSKQICEAWKKMLEMRLRDRFRTACIISWWKGLKVGDWDMSSEAETVAKSLVIYELNDLLVKGYFEKRKEIGHTEFHDTLEMINDLVCATSWDWWKSKKIREEVEQMFVTAFANGWAFTASYLFSRFGDRFDLWSNYPEEAFNEALNRIMRGAQAEAEDNGRFGIACAIAEHLDDTPNADRLHDLARSQKQKICLKFGFNCRFARH